MNVSEAVLKRQSIRAFKPDPIPIDMLKGIIETALRAPSASNTQICEYAVVSGEKLSEIKAAMLANVHQSPTLDLPVNMNYTEPWLSRNTEIVRGIQQMLGIARDDRQKRIEWRNWGMNMWGAPSCIFLYIDKGLYGSSKTPNSYCIFDCGLAAQTIMLLATADGLGTIPAVMPVFYPDILRKALDLPSNKLFVIGISIGYPDWDHPANKFRSSREPLEKMAKFY